MGSIHPGPGSFVRPSSGERHTSTEALRRNCSAVASTSDPRTLTLPSLLIAAKRPKGLNASHTTKNGRTVRERPELELCSLLPSAFYAILTMSSTSGPDECIPSTHIFGTIQTQTRLHSFVVFWAKQHSNV